MVAKSEPPVEFPITEELKQYGFTRIAQVGPFIKSHYNGLSFHANFNVANLKKSANELREEAIKVVTSNGIDASSIVEKYVTFVISQATAKYEKDLAEGKLTVGSSKKADSNSEKEERDGSETSVTTMKYTIKHETELPLSQLWETVKVGGKYWFVSYDPFHNKVIHTDTLTDKAQAKTVHPFAEDGAVEHYSYDSFEELQQTVQNAKLYTASILFKKVEEWAAKFFDTDTKEYTNLIAADIVFTYFADVIGKTHYIFVYGEPDQGKGSILETFNQLAYRGASVTSVTPATVYRMLGSVEKGQITMIIDEANKLEEDEFLLTILKVGYKGNSKVPRSVDTQSSDAKMQYFYAYCFKIIAAEKLPTPWKTGGFLSRCLKVKTAPGNPEIDIGDVVDNAGDPNNAAIMEELIKLRKLLFAYRLLHRSEPIPDIKIRGITGRDKELIKPVLRLFNTHGGYDTEVFDTIKNTLHYFIKEHNEDKVDSLNAKVLDLIKTRIAFNSDGKAELSFADIWDYTREQLSGEPIDDKPKFMRTSLFGDISKDRLAAIMRNLGGNRAKDPTGDKRVWVFDAKTLDRFSKAYKLIPDTIEIEEQTTLDSAMANGHEEGVEDDSE